MRYAGLLVKWLTVGPRGQGTTPRRILAFMLWWRTWAFLALLGATYYLTLVCIVSFDPWIAAPMIMVLTGVTSRWMMELSPRYTVVVNWK